jgi:hypothetical protein
LENYECANDYEQHIAWAEYQRLMQEIAFEIPTRQNELNLPRTDDIRIGDKGPVMRAAGGWSSFCDDLEVPAVRCQYADRVDFVRTGSLLVEHTAPGCVTAVDGKPQFVASLGIALGRL